MVFKKTSANAEVFFFEREHVFVSAALRFVGHPPASHKIVARRI